MSDTFDKCPVCDQIGFRIHVCTDGDPMYICDNCGVCLWTEELETKMSDTTCKSCWWQEGGLCYTGRFERDENGRSNKKADKPCGLHSSKRKMLEKYFDGNKLIIMSEENK